MKKTVKKVAIYEAKGRAREYSELAMNHLRGCDHCCRYCYAHFVTHVDAEEFKHPVPRVTPDDIDRSAAAFEGDKRPVLLSFTTDPYCSMERKTALTRTAIEILHKHGLRVTILTKGGNRALRDFDLLRPGDAFAVTLTCLSQTESEYWEPSAAPPQERLHTLSVAHSMGIETWVSLEPVLYPEDTMALIKTSMPYVNSFKVGMLNYNKHADSIDWKSFGWSIKSYLEGLGAKYYIKADLRYEMGIKDAGGSAGPQSKKAIGDHVAGLVKGGS